MTVELTCSACGATKPEDDFPIRRTAATGRRGQCLDCFRPVTNAQRRNKRTGNKAGGNKAISSTAAAASTPPPQLTLVVATETHVTFPAWMDEAACRGMDTEIFYQPMTERGGRLRGWSSDPAKEICHSCPVEDECLEWVLNQTGHWTDHGIWAGTTYKDRKELRKQRQIKRGRADTFARNHRTTPRGAA